MERTCKKCGETKPIEEFTKNKNCKNGVTSECLCCKNDKQLKFRSNNREYTNTQARTYGDKRYPHRIEHRKLIDAGFKKCSKCGNVFEFKEFHEGRSICYKCRTKHDRGIFINKTDDGRYIKVLTDEERKSRQRECVKKWAKANPEKVRAIQKRSSSRPVRKIKIREYARQRYHAGFTYKESRLKYDKSEKGIITHNKARKKWNTANPEKLKLKEKRQIENLNSCYVVAKLKRQTGLSIGILRQYPKLIEAKQAHLKLKRLIHENSNRP
jgi:hypothetical protein